MGRPLAARMSASALPSISGPEPQVQPMSIAVQWRSAIRCLDLRNPPICGNASSAAARRSRSVEGAADVLLVDQVVRETFRIRNRPRDAFAGVVEGDA